MDLLVQFAQKVVKAVSELSPFGISLSDDKGYIIGATNAERVGTYHLPSKEVIEKDDYVIFDKIKIKNMENVFEGIAFPLQFDYKTIGVLGIIGPPEQVEPYGLLIKNYVEMIWQESFHKQITDMETKTKETFAQYILLNETVETERVKQYCDMVGIPYGKKNFCIVIDISNSLLHSAQKHISIDQLKENLLRCTQKAYACLNNGLCTFLNTEKIVVVRQVENMDEYKNMLKNFDKQSREVINLFAVYAIKDPSIAAGGLSHSIEEVSKSYQEAVNLLRFAKERKIEPAIHTAYNWNIISEKLPLQISTSYRETILFRINTFVENERFSEMTDLFIAYCENNMNISQTAKSLFIHRNTLIYRLKKIEEMTSINTSNFQDCMILYLALKN